MTKLSPAQTKALEIIRAEGVVYYGNVHGITSATVKALRNRGLIELEWKVHYRTNDRSRTVAERDWSARPIDA